MKIKRAMRSLRLCFMAIVAMFAVVSCTQNIDETVVGGRTTIFAMFEDSTTRMLLDSNGVTPLWEQGDEIYVNDVLFTASEGGRKVAFTSDSAEELSGSYIALYRGKGVAKAEIVAEQTARVGSFPCETPAYAVGEDFRSGATLKFKNAAALLKFRANLSGDYLFSAIAGEAMAGEYSVNADGTIAYDKADESAITLKGCKAGNTYYVAVAPTTLSEGLEVKVGGEVVKSGGVGAKFERNHIYNLGSLGPDALADWGLVGEHQGWDLANLTPMVETETAGLYVAENVTLATDGFKFAKFGLSDWDTPNSYFGAYAATEGLEYFDFVAGMAAGGWYEVYDNNLAEQSINIGVTDWTKGYDVYLYVAEKGEGWNKLAYTVVEHGTEVTLPEETTPELGFWGLVGEHQGWDLANPTPLVETSTADLYVAENVELAADGFLFAKQGLTGWDIPNTTFGAWTKAEGKEYYDFTAEVGLGGWYEVCDNNLAEQAANIGVEDWSKSYDVYLYIAERADWGLRLKYTIVEHGTEVTLPEETPDTPDTPEDVVEPGAESAWAILGVFNDWKDKYMVGTAEPYVVVAEDVQIDAATGFLFRKPSTEWTDKYAAGDINYIKANSYITTVKGGGDLCLEASGLYDIYFNTNTKVVYVMADGEDYKSATEQTVSGTEPEQEEPEVTELVVYLKPNANWMAANARFAAYFFNNGGNVWVSMTAVGDGTYQCNIPQGYALGDNVIFCRMNPSTTSNNWNNKWDQTKDLVVPTDGNNLYTVADGAWNNADGTWSKKE